MWRVPSHVRLLLSLAIVLSFVSSLEAQPLVMSDNSVEPLPSGLDEYQMVIKIEITDPLPWTLQQLHDAQNMACYHVANSTGIPTDDVLCTNEDNSTSSTPSSVYSYLVEVIFQRTESAKQAYFHYTTNASSLWELTSKTIHGHGTSGAHSQITFEKRATTAPIGDTSQTTRLIVGLVVGLACGVAGFSVGLVFFIRYLRSKLKQASADSSSELDSPR